MQYRLVLLLIFFVPLSWSNAAYAIENCPSESISIIISVQGTIVFDANGNGNWLEANLNQPICEGSRIWVKSDSRGSLLLPGNDVLRLNENTILTLKTTNLNKPSVLDVVKGFLHYLSRKPKEVKIESGIANAAPLGTEFAFRVDDAKASLWVYEGDVRFFNQQGSITLKPGQTAQAQLGKAPRYQIDIRPDDAVNWALYYPPLLPYHQDRKQENPDTQHCYPGVSPRPDRYCFGATWHFNAYAAYALLLPSTGCHEAYCWTGGTGIAGYTYLANRKP